MKRALVCLVVLMLAAAASAQSAGAYESSGGESASTSVSGDGSAGSAGPVAPSGGLLDPSRLSVSHSMSFYAGGSQVSNVKSQSVYSTMFQYKFNAPVVLSLNFDMPIHSTFNQYNNFNAENLSSLDYFRNMPIDAAVTWQPHEKFMLGVRVIKMPESAGYYNWFSGALYSALETGPALGGPANRPFRRF